MLGMHIIKKKGTDKYLSCWRDHEPVWGPMRMACHYEPGKTDGAVCSLVELNEEVEIETSPYDY